MKTPSICKLRKTAPVTEAWRGPRVRRHTAVFGRVVGLLFPLSPASRSSSESRTGSSAGRHLHDQSPTRAARVTPPHSWSHGPRSLVPRALTADTAPRGAHGPQQSLHVPSDGGTRAAVRDSERLAANPRSNGVKPQPPLRELGLAPPQFILRFPACAMGARWPRRIPMTKWSQA